VQGGRALVEVAEPGQPSGNGHDGGTTPAT
jgi:hypothetical protein